MDLSQTDKQKSDILVEVLDEGTETWRKTKALALGNSVFQVLATEDYDSAEEAWAFLPGDKVRLEGRVMVDKRLHQLARHPDKDVIRMHVESPQDAIKLRVTHARKMSNGLYKILTTPHYDPDRENWNFPPGSLVKLKKKVVPEGKIIIAIAP
jgi:hypothetical protein